MRATPPDTYPWDTIAVDAILRAARVKVPDWATVGQRLMEAFTQLGAAEIEYSAWYGPYAEDELWELGTEWCTH